MTTYLPTTNNFSSREKRSSQRGQLASNHKVGQDLVFSQKHIRQLSSSFPRSFWVLSAISVSFLLSQALMFLMTK